MSLLLLSLVFTSFISSNGDAILDFLSEFDQYVNMDAAETFWLGWSVLDDTTIEFGMVAEATGWIAMGISPTGFMPDSDVALAYVNDTTGEAYLYDVYTLCRCRPFLDPSQDLTLISGSQVDGRTYITFQRDINACTDTENDLSILEGTTRVIFAYQYENRDPTDPLDAVGTMAFHGFGATKGSKSINLLDLPPLDIPFPNDTQTYDVVMSNFSVPADRTNYICRLFEFPRADDPQDIIKLEPIIQEGNEDYVHHYIVSNCLQEYVDLAFLDQDVDCTAYLFSTMNLCFNLNQIYAWAVGGGSLTFPDNVGMRISSQNDTSSDQLRYGVLQIHYDNVNEVSGIFDSSGIRFHHTSELREYDLTMISVGAKFRPDFVTGLDTESIFVPNNLGDTISKSYCPSTCTETLPTNGSYIIASLLHSHLIGVGIKARHVRNGIELPYIDNNPSYDFDFQQMNLFGEPLEILPGDEIIVECTYNTENENESVFSGFGTFDEMCIAFLLVYPKPPFEICVSKFTDTDWTNFFDTAVANGYYNATSNVYDTNRVDALEAYDNFLNLPTRRMECSNRAGIFFVDEELSIVEVLEPYVPPDLCPQPPFIECSQEYQNCVVECNVSQDFDCRNGTVAECIDFCAIELDECNDEFFCEDEDEEEDESEDESEEEEEGERRRNSGEDHEH